MLYRNSLFVVLALCFLVSCEQSDPIDLVDTEMGDISFSGYQWYTKSSEQQVGPGPNYFSESSENIWKDSDGQLHIKISYDGNQWNCAEVISVKEFGYGTYIFTVSSDLTTMNEQAVLGLFTWNTYSFQTQGNSEVDIEFSRWGNAQDSTLLTYSVQPVWFSISGPYTERSIKPNMQVSKLASTTTHVFTWTPEKVTWESYEGDSYPGTDKLASWEFDNTNIARRKYEGNSVSEPIVIPAPEDSTNARINLWLLGGTPPADLTETEVVIKSFQYKPL